MSGIGNYIVFIVLFLLSVPAGAQLRINEILASNASVSHDPDFGVFADFIELHNASSLPIVLNNYTMTDKPGNPGKWVFPDMTLQPGAYIVLWADGRDLHIGDTAFSEYRENTIAATALHVSFSLSADGEYVGIFDADGQLVDEVQFGVHSTDISYGRDPADPDSWLFFTDVTPGSSNSSYGAASLLFAPEPLFSVGEGFYPKEQTLRITTAAPEAVVHFTFDGSAPDIHAAVFPDSFTVFRNLVIKARVYQKGKLPGPVVTKSFFIGEHVNLPVVSLSAESEQLQDVDFGILRNGIRRREVKTTMEYFDTTKTRGFVADVGIRVFGTTIHALPQRPLSIRFRSRYGDSELVYPLFGDRDNKRYSSLMLRNGGNDYNLAYLRDGLATNLAKQRMDIDYQEYKPCIVFINGDYHGIYELRERVDEQHLSSIHGLSHTGIDLLEDSLQVVQGDERRYMEFLRLLIERDITDPETYAMVAKEMDIDAYINYMIHKIFIGYRLFQYNNRYWHGRDGAPRWRWIANDLEHAFGQLSGDAYQENTLMKAAGATGELPDWATMPFRRLLENRTFRDTFLQRFALYLQTTYRPTQTIAVLDSLQALIAPEMPRHIHRWGTPVTLSVWEDNVDFIRTFLTQRPTHLRDHLSQYFAVSDSARLELRIEGNGAIVVAGVTVTDTLFSAPVFHAAGISLSAVPLPGYRFLEWRGLATDSATTVLYPSGDNSIVAVFERSEGSIIPADIVTDTTLQSTDGPWYAVEDVVVHAGAVLTVEEGVEIRMTDHVSCVVYGGLHLLGSAHQPIRIHPDPEATARRPLYNRLPRWGVISANTATDSILIRHVRISGSGYGRDRRKEFATLTSINSYVHISHTSIDNNIQPFYSEGGSVYIGYSLFRSENTCDLINVKYCDQAVVEYCDLGAAPAYDTDAIDYDGVNGGIIRHNYIHALPGDNSDGIDLGEGSKDIQIEYNVIRDCFDKGISIGQASTAIILNNVIFNCDMGIALKDFGSHAEVDRNTLYGNNVGVACYEKNTSRGGATAQVRNTILAASLSQPVTVDERSSIAVRYSLSDTEPLPGEKNLYADPLFVSTAVGNFELRSNSPCIDAGDPASPLDPDGSRADIGAHYVHQGRNELSVHINEINYHSSANYDTGDWVEIANRSDTTVHLSGWRITHAEGTFVFPEPTTLLADDFLVVCEDTVLFRRFHPGVRNIAGTMLFSLGNGGGTINLLDKDQRIVQTLRYDDDWPWPPLADGKGATVELIPGRVGKEVSDWRESYLLMGTPGEENSEAPDRRGLYLNELMALNGNVIADEYGEYDDWFEIYNANSHAVNIGGLYFTDDLATPTKWQVPLDVPELTRIEPGGFLLLWADGDPRQGPLHADFRLSGSGEQLGMFQRFHEGYSMVDGIIFGEQLPNISYGRYPNGGQLLTLMSPTPAFSNVPSSVDHLMPSSLVVYPNPFDTHFTMHTGSISTPFTLHIYNVLGILVKSVKHLSTDKIMIERGLLSPGLYFYHIHDLSGKHYLGKLIAK